MASNTFALFDTRRSKWTQPDGTLTFEAQIFLRELWLRIGGAIGSDNNAILDIANEALALGREAQLGLFAPRREQPWQREMEFAQLMAQIVAFLPRQSQPDVRAGSNVTVARDAAGYVVSATSGSGSPESDQSVLAMRIFGV